MKFSNHGRFVGMFLFLSICLFVTSSCLPEDDGSPQISSLTITPSTINKSSTGMTDQYFTIVIKTANFTEPLDSAEVRIEELDRTATTNTPPEISGDTITIKNVAFAWFTDAPAGDYSINAKVFSENDLQTATQLDLAKVTVTDE